MELPLSLSLQKHPFVQSQTHELKHWNSIIKHHTKLKDDVAILTTYNQMESLGILPDNATLPLVLKACGRLQAIEKGKKLHNSILSTNLASDIRVQTALVNFYSKCGMLQNALNVFDEMTQRDVVSWNAMISGCVCCYEYQKALRLFSQMQKVNLKANSVTIVELLQVCGELLELRSGKEIHGYSLRHGLFNTNPHVDSSLMGFYLKFDPWIASLVFETLASRNTVSWNTMISGYINHGDFLKALKLFILMLNEGFKCDSITMLVVIQACAEFGDHGLGMQVHQLVIKFGYNNMHIVNSLVNMYNKYADLKSSYELFTSIPTKDVALWNSMLSCYVENGLINESIHLLNKMQLEGIKVNERTIVIILPLCANLSNGLINGKSLHAYAFKIGNERNKHIGNSLVNMYTLLNCVEDATKVFNKMKDIDVISCNVFISALANNKLKVQSCEIFTKMLELEIKPNSQTITSILSAFDGIDFWKFGKCIHGYVMKCGIEIDASLNTALTEMYINCEDESTGMRVFEEFPDKDLISWNSLLSTYIKNNQPYKTLLLFHHMITSVKVKPNFVTIINILSLYTHLSNLPQGKFLHAYTLRRFSSLNYDLPLVNAFLTMYSRCGSLEYAENLFNVLPKPNIISWNAMIAGYGMHGHGDEAMLTFSKMVKQGFTPNRVTFISALSACSHSGMIQKGLQLFYSMVQDFGITPEVVHYSCLVDLLARGGFLNEAKNVIDTMPMAPDAATWRALIGGCRVYSDTHLAKTAFENLIELEPKNPGNYVLLSNIYAASGLWDEVKSLRLILENKGLKKPAGRSWIVIKSQLHFFAAGDKSHPQSETIYRKLTSLLTFVKEMGYVPDLRWVLHDEDDERKMVRLSSHSEKLAIAFGLINVSGGSRILITKNLRICGDCHEFSKYVSKLLRRTIIIRDATRFHHFVDGLCSCKDYW
ncbi:pentatricopeptide repeat-containing protein At1g08070, chloroplastic [Lactuca sativa]|uniref:pentatricopeptide repeat-containing protein At1g08070, chloroplastic n=1 Tax=Lactuca sativa TaxID=4236 RepID=UPI000CBCECF4|nr:pentatricopeptide repeat-containing protein At1g08070, chloroplastic [Lactuca sativa]